MPPIACDDKDAVLAEIADAARAAGDMAMGYFRPGAETAARVDYKQGGSPVTEADMAVDHYLRDRLCAAMPEAAWLSEETADDLGRLDYAHVLVVDPIDGTRCFAAGDPHWAVSIALVTEGRPVAGVVHAPAMGMTFEAVLGGGARRNGARILASRRGVLAGARIAAPAGFVQPAGPGCRRRARTQDPLAGLPLRARGGRRHRLARSPRPMRMIGTSPAVDLILHEAGGILSGADALPLGYNRRNPRHPALYGAGPVLQSALVAAGRRSLGHAAREAWAVRRRTDSRPLSGRLRRHAEKV